MILLTAAPGVVALAALAWGLTRVPERKRTMWLAGWAALVALAGLTVFLVAPTISYVQATVSVTAGAEGSGLPPEPVVERGMRSQLEEALSPALLRVSLAWVLLALLAPAGAWLHEREGLPAGRWLIWAAAAALLLLTLLGAFSIGPFIAPGALLALVSAALAQAEEGTRS